METKDKIAILGAGESGIGAALLAQSRGYNVFVSDNSKIADEYKTELDELDIPFEENGHTLAKILKANLIVKSPGIPEATEIVKEIRQQNKEIISEIEWAFRHRNKGRIIAITGTNGKSTTTALTGHLLKEAGVNVKIGGNYGISFARLLATEAPADWYVIEVSSFQLDDIKSFCPDVAVLLNITPDHLDRYGQDFQKYIAAKFKIAQYQTKKNLFIINADDTAIANNLKKYTPMSKIVKFSRQESNVEKVKNKAFQKEDKLNFYFEDEPIEISINDLKIKGQHNIYNSMAAGISAKAAGLRSEKLQECFATFSGIPHRLEFVNTIGGVHFYNDSKGTNLNSVWFALESMETPVVLILGGQDKGNNYNEIKDIVEEKVHDIVCLGIDNQKIINSLSQSVNSIVETQSANDAVKASYALSEKGDSVLLSPGCASFDLFKNFEDRGNQFKEAVRNL